MFAIVSRSKFAKIRVLSEMMCVRGNLYKKLLFDTELSDFGVTYEVWVYIVYILTYAEILMVIQSIRRARARARLSYKSYHIHKRSHY